MDYHCRDCGYGPKYRGEQGASCMDCGHGRWLQSWYAGLAANPKFDPKERIEYARYAGIKTLQLGLL
jgi:hypothetical protein